MWCSFGRQTDATPRRLQLLPIPGMLILRNCIFEPSMVLLAAVDEIARRIMGLKGIETVITYSISIVGTSLMPTRMCNAATSNP